MYPSVVRRRLLAALVLSGLAAVAFATGLSLARGEPAEADRTFVQGDQTLREAGWQHDLASRFDDYGQELACGGTLAPDQLGVASRTLPCGTIVTFTYRGRTVQVPVIDRGPWIDGREWDLTGAAAEALGFPGLAVVTWRL
ncbi:septal ring lytic transglycosylase RlpA family protein [Conexibacter woesei]|uniref:Rare lipoprotein A n=1 Tax=Conexibacter woesei (strain DSM 14684 / CCUG 47730 / CIP 108061 / JCM 11494 / NBRC 100937 / ID131577) TaxID=469383 RepID=D3FEZ1_CONWI|nr:septal ring lytic transglycosylase RlpA family protein [Conexibacter woesei]ADB51708.1 Rare lipoprotein A [Conexibacter woesei DSM 14684]